MCALKFKFHRTHEREEDKKQVFPVIYLYTIYTVLRCQNFKYFNFSELKQVTVTLSVAKILEPINLLSAEACEGNQNPGRL